MTVHEPTRRSPALAFALATAFALGGCSVEINVESAGDGHTHDPVEAPEAPRVDADAPMPTAPPAVRAPRAPVLPPPPPTIEEPADGAVRDALLRFREEVPPPPPAREDLAEGPTFTPFTVAPAILNRSEVVETMQREYPPLLKDAGIGGTVRVYFFIEADGTVGRVLLDSSSGHPALDEAALRVADVYRFSPAKNRTQDVPVWVSFPITFQVR